MAQELLLNIEGLKTNPSPVRVPAGSLVIAKNVNIDSPNTAVSRRGFKKYGDQLTLGESKKILKMFTYDDTILVHYNDNKLAYDSDGAGTWQNYSGTYAAADDNIGIREILLSGNLYFNTSEGVKRLDSVTGTIKDAGAPKGLTATAALTGSSGFFTAETQVAYRIVWGYKDANNINVYGAASERIEIANTNTATRDVSLRIYIPEDVTTSYFFQVYRSSFSAGVSSVANDEMSLVYEDNPTSGDITNGYVDMTDNVPDSLRGATIYMAPSQQGIGKNNDIPPYCKDITIFKDCALYANTKTRHRMYLTLTAVGGSSGVAVDDVITINGVAYTGKATESTAIGNFLVETSGTPAENIEDTARSFVKTINLYSSNTELYAYYISGYDDLPGKILIERRDLTDTTFYAIASAHGSAWDPTLPTSGQTVYSTNEEKPNRIYVSKTSQPDAVPIGNYIDVGSEASEIIRIIALRDSVFALKDDGEVYRIVGDDIDTFTVRLFDNTAKIWGPKTAVVFNNQIWCFSNQGIVSLSDSGVEVKSWDIEQDIIQFLSLDNNQNFRENAFAMAYESDRKYILCYNDNQYVYNSFTESWTNWDVPADIGYLNSADDKIYFGKSTGYIYQERKAYQDTDHADEELDVTIVSASGYTVTLSDASSCTVGHTLLQGTLRKARITAIDGNDLTVDKFFSWEAGAATENEPITCELKWTPIIGDNPSIMKRFKELLIIFRDMNKPFTVGFEDNFEPTYTEEIEITPEYAHRQWGDLTWGGVLWGGSASGSQENRTYFPTDKQRSLWSSITISTEQAFTKFSLTGVCVLFDYQSTKFIKAS